MNTFARLQLNARTPFKPGEVIRMEDGKRFRPIEKKPRKPAVAKVKVPRA